MKKQYLLLISFLFVAQLWAQTTETFETETTGSTSFTDNGKVFNITSQVMGPFDIYSGGSAYGWNGSSADYRFIDNSGTGGSAFNTPVQFTISSAGGMAFTLKSFYAYLAKSDITLNVTGSLTITGKLGGVTVFTATANSPFNTNAAVNNGFTYINMVNFGGQNNSNIAIDQFVIATSGNIAYVALDAMTWQCPSVTLSQAAKTNVSCLNGNNGTATVSASGGNGFTYDWSPGTPAGDGTATATGLSAGNWTVTVTNSCGLSNSTVFNITQPATALTATQSQTNVSCNGGSNGVASVTASGGGGSYTYSWSPSGGSAATATGLTAGNYTVTITDANNCSIQKQFTITAPVALTATQSQTNVSCNGGSNGVASVTASGGTGSYTYSWSPSGGSAATATGLTAGNYTVTITDANNCSIQKQFTITAPAALTATQSQTNVNCNGGSNGVASVTASGGTGSYTYSWSPSGGSAATATGLTAGNYTVTITDANSCSIQKQFTITNAADCSIATTWNGTSWSNGAPACNAFAATINGNYDSSVNGEITACSLTVNSGTVTVAGGDNFIIKGAVTVSGGSLTFEQNSNLVQTDNVANTGTITYKRNSSLLYGLDYTIWSSPVTGSQTLKDFSPQTLDERFYVYNTALNAYSNYLSASGIFGGNPDEETFVAAKGYLIRMPDNLDDNVATVFNGTFIGTPNNGNISIGLNTQGNGFNAVGNPYPSPINVQDFLIANQPNLDNGTLYFWRKKNGTTGTTYATVTLAAYVASTSEGGDTSGGAFNAGQEANWVINPGQGFLVKAAPGATALSFNNSMRRAVNNGQFFRMDAGNALPPLTGPTSKLWLNLTSENNDFGQTAVAYTDITTTGLDYAYDGRLVNDGGVAVYSIVAETKLAIQAREAFNVQDEVAIGYKTTNEGNYTISLNQVTGAFNEGQDVYLRDNLLNVEHNLSDSGSYTFASPAGTFDTRFNIIYTTALGIGVAPADTNSITVSNNSNVITVHAGSHTIKDVTIYDIQGRVIYSRNGISTVMTQISDLTAAQQMLIVQVTTIEGGKVSKKIIY